MEGKGYLQKLCSDPEQLYVRIKCHIILYLMLCQSHLGVLLGLGEEESTY